MSFRYRLRTGKHTKAVPDVYAEAISRGKRRSGTGRAVIVRLGDLTVKMTPTDAVRLADALIDATEVPVRPKKRVKRLSRADHVKPTPQTPAWTSQSTAYNHSDN